MRCRTSGGAPLEIGRLRVVAALHWRAPMRAVAVVVLLLAGTAAADPLDLRESVARTPAVEIEAADVHLGWRADVVASSAGAGTRGEHGAEQAASASAEVSVSSADCDFVVAGGQVDARTGAGAPLALQQWASVCPLSGVLRFEIDHRLIWDVTPRLLAPPRLRPSGNRRETIGFEMSVWQEKPFNRWNRMPVPREYAELGAARVEMGFGWTGDSATELDGSASAHVDFIHWVRERLDASPALHVRVVSFAMEVNMPPVTTDEDGVRTGLFATTARFDAVSVDGVHLGGLRVGGALGFGMAIVAASTDRMTSSDRSALAGRATLSLERDVGGATARLAAGRDLWPTWDGRAVIDDRATASVAAPIGGLRGRVEVSAARVGLLAATGFRQTTAGGVAASAERDLGPHLTARAHLELGRSVYAAGATFEQPRWAAEGQVSLQLHAGNR